MRDRPGMEREGEEPAVMATGQIEGRDARTVEGRQMEATDGVGSSRPDNGTEDVAASRPESTQGVVEAGQTGASRGSDEGSATAEEDEPRTALLEPEELESFRVRWQAIQADFVDEPRRSVEEADQLVATVMGQLAESFSRERGRLEQQWDQGDEVSTEDLRVVLRRYRSFFERLLAA